MPAAGWTQESQPAGHLPLNLTDFTPTVSGHPVFDKIMSTTPMTTAQQAAVRHLGDATFADVARQWRPNNFAVSAAFAMSTAFHTIQGTPNNRDQIAAIAQMWNDSLAFTPYWVTMSATDRQNKSDAMIYAAALILYLRERGEHDPEAKQESLRISHALLQRMTAGQSDVPPEFAGTP